MQRIFRPLTAASAVLFRNAVSKSTRVAPVVQRIALPALAWLDKRRDRKDQGM